MCAYASDFVIIYKNEYVTCYDEPNKKSTDLVKKKGKMLCFGRISRKRKQKK